MNYTENYQLPQWEESDQILREDFNSAMAGIDREIEKIKSEMPVQKLVTQTLKETDSQVIIHLSQFDLSQYSRLEFCARGSSDPSDESLCLQVNGDGEEHYDYRALDSSIEYTSNAWPICGNFGNNTVAKGSILSSGTEGNLVVQWSSLGYSNTFPSFYLYGGLHKTLRFLDLSFLRFFSINGTLLKGTTITIYGFKQ